jgi:hypothetical protein
MSATFNNPQPRDLGNNSCASKVLLQEEFPVETTQSEFMKSDRFQVGKKKKKRYNSWLAHIIWLL